jgi:hypothetical protein
MELRTAGAGGRITFDLARNDAQAVRSDEHATVYGPAGSSPAIVAVTTAGVVRLARVFVAHGPAETSSAHCCFHFCTSSRQTAVPQDLLHERAGQPADESGDSHGRGAPERDTQRAAQRRGAAESSSQAPEDKEQHQGSRHDADGQGRMG